MANRSSIRRRGMPVATAAGTIGDDMTRTRAEPVPGPAAIRRILRTTFGLDRLREGQEAVIASVMRGKPTLAVMPTGAGKSLCYQLPALALPGLTIVVSPLIALMKDQCDKLRDMGVAACQLNSAVAAAELAEAEGAVRDGSAKIAFTTPERLADPTFLELVSGQRVSLLVVDEVHCISQWGHDFRPAFLEIGQAFARLGRPRLLTLTATATAPVIDDIARQLGVDRFEIVNTGTYRANLHYRVIQVTNESDKLERVVEIAASSKGAGLIYTATIKAAESVHAALVAKGVDAALYHGRIGAARRREAQEAFMSGRVRVMVATNAFGLGIDKADTRFVVHYQMPAGLDAYYQESGRAGRDGKPADCTLLFLHADRSVQQFFLAGKYPSREDLVSIYNALRADPGQDTSWTAERLEAKLSVSKTKLQVALRLLRHEKVVRMSGDGALVLTRQGLDDGALDRLLEGYRGKREGDRDMLERMVFYAQTGRCRWKVLLDHFGESLDESGCGSCDNCIRFALAREQEAKEGEATTPGPGGALASDEKATAVEFAPGDAVRVPRYGRGVVDSIDAAGINVMFAGDRRRMFLAAFVRPVAGTARRRPRPLPATRG